MLIITKYMECPYIRNVLFRSMIHSQSAIQLAASRDSKARFSDFSYPLFNESHNDFPDEDALSSLSSKHRRNHMDSLNREARTQERA